MNNKIKKDIHLLSDLSIISKGISLYTKTFKICTTNIDSDEYENMYDVMQDIINTSRKLASTIQKSRFNKNGKYDNKLNEINNTINTWS